jgi:hypothetical protein
MKYLTKSDFLIAADCDRKMYYKKNNYTNHVYEDEFMSLLAEGGLLVEYVAKMLFEGGQDIDYKSNEANITMTNKLIDEHENITLFDPAFRHGKLLSKMDIVVKDGNELTLYDVHSSSFDGPDELLFNKNGTLKADKKKLIEDTAFQVLILKKKYPNMRIIPMLMVLDKTKKNRYPNLLNNFKFEKTQRLDEGEIKPIIEFTGLKKQIVVDNDLFVRVDVTEAVNKIMPEVQLRVERLVQFIKGDKVEKPMVALSKVCKNCEFKEGKEECWKHMPNHDNDIFELYHNTTQKIDGENVLDGLITERKVSLFDWPIDELKVGKITGRQKIQIENTKAGTEWIDKDMLNQIEGFKYPLHFIDFETTRPAIPHNKDDRPYEQLAFQWSCHTLPAPGAELVHKEWISFEKGFPNFNFAESLMKHLKNSGTVFMWHHHEKTVLKDIKNQIIEREYENERLFNWLEKMTTSGRMVDMNVMAKDFYFHPDMKGQTSIKKVLPAVWNNSPYIADDYNVQQFFKPEQLQLEDPYKMLEDNPELRCEQFDKINIGTDAIVAYQQMMRDLYMGDHVNAKNIKKMLIEYCKLDTFAMYIIWVHWINSLIDNRQELIDDIVKVVRNNGNESITNNTYLVREKDLFNGFKIGGFRGLRNAELRMIHIPETVDDLDRLSFEIFNDNSSNSRTSKLFMIERIPNDLLKKVHTIVTSDKCDSLNAEFQHLWSERKDLQTQALTEKTLTSKQSDRLRYLNDTIQQIVDNHDKV